MFQAWNMRPSVSWRILSGSLNPLNSDLLAETFSILFFLVFWVCWFFFCLLFFPCVPWIACLCFLGYLSVVFLMVLLHRKSWSDQIAETVRTFSLGDSCGFSWSSCKINPTGILVAISLFKSIMKPRKCEKGESRTGIFDKLSRIEGYFTFQNYDIWLPASRGISAEKWILWREGCRIYISNLAG